jgi:hypothetical protein
MDELARDAGTENPFRRPQVVGGGGRVPGHDQPEGHVDEAEGGAQCEKQVQESGDSCLALDRTHVRSSPGRERPAPVPSLGDRAIFPRQWVLVIMRCRMKNDPKRELLTSFLEEIDEPRIPP